MSEWHGELRLAFVDEDRVIFHKDVHDAIPLTPGRRYAAVFVEIADDESLAPQNPDRQAVKRSQRHPSQVAAILCKETEFQVWAAHQMSAEGRGELPPNEETATEYVRRRCKISSRAQLDLEAGPLQDFHLLIELPYYQWRRGP